MEAFITSLTEEQKRMFKRVLMDALRKETSTLIHEGLIIEDIGKAMKHGTLNGKMDILTTWLDIINPMTKPNPTS